MKRIGVLVVSGAVLAVVGGLGCAWLVKRQAIRRCEFQILSVWPTRYSLLDPRLLDLEVRVGVKNPNDVDAVLEPFRWHLLVGETEIAHGERWGRLEVPAGRETEFLLPVRADLWEGAKSLVKAVIDGSAEYRMPATVYLGTAFGDIEYEVLIERGRWTSAGGFEKDPLPE
ncbi:MAG: LEA type 2 family protein [Planctomycetes bacterium]|nr:LEA type 2 family protein [Planctomycetota bacterium]